MPGDFSSKDVWNHCHFDIRDGVFSIREARHGESYFAIGLILVPPLLLGFAFYFQYGYFGILQLFICLIALSIFAVSTVKHYNAPRALRYFPNECVIERSRLFFFFRYTRLWFDLEQSSLTIAEVLYEADVCEEDRDLSRRNNKINDYIALIDPLRPIFDFYRLAKRPKKIHTGYALVDAKDRKVPIAVFKHQGDAIRVLDAISES